MAKKKKKLVNPIKKIAEAAPALPAPSDEELAKLELELTSLANQCLAAIESHELKAFVIVQTKDGKGVSQASKNFSLLELFGYISAIQKLNNINV